MYLDKYKGKDEENCLLIKNCLSMICKTDNLDLLECYEDFVKNCLHVLVVSNEERIKNL